MYMFVCSLYIDCIEQLDHELLHCIILILVFAIDELQWLLNYYAIVLSMQCIGYKTSFLKTIASYP